MTVLRAAALAALVLLASCVSRDGPAPMRSSAEPVNAPAVPSTVPPPPVPPPPANARLLGVSLATTPYGLDATSARRAHAAFIASCPVLLKRADATGLTRTEDWRSACEAGVPSGGDQAYADWFASAFEFVRVGPGTAFATGYFEPEIAGSRVRVPGYEVPIYRTPPDLVRGTFADGTAGRGRTDETGAFVLYFDRERIDAGALANRGLEIGYAADAIDLFFLQIQGSGRLRLPDGGVMRIGYAGQNGREYVAIGRLLKERGVLGSGQTSMQGIVGWLRANPDEARDVLNANKSYVFFQESVGAGPLGSIGVPVTPQATVAVDPRFVPYGAPVLLTMDAPGASGLWVAQDTGGAIKGANRFDTFWGAGEAAKRTAGRMQARGQALILLPRGTVARLQASGWDARAQR